MRNNSKNSSRRSTAFTLVELLVVIGIIGLLISILIPALARARESAQSTACKAQLHQFALANEMYVNESKGWCVDVYKLYDYDKGLVKYFNQKIQMSERVARCPGDQTTENMQRLGTMGNSTNVNYKIRNAQGDFYVVLVSYGANENSSSASLQVGPAGTTQRWIKRMQLMKQGVDITKVMTYGDYQYNRGESTATLAGQMAPTVGPGWLPPNAAANDKMGSLAFRHRNKFNAAFLDGHVGDVSTKKRLTASGHALQTGETWSAVPASLGLPASVTSYGSYASHKIFYPFGPATSGMVLGVYGTMDGWQIN